MKVWSAVLATLQQGKNPTNISTIVEDKFTIILMLKIIKLLTTVGQIRKIITFPGDKNKVSLGIILGNFRPFKVAYSLNYFFLNMAVTPYTVFRRLVPPALGSKNLKPVSGLPVVSRAVGGAATIPRSEMPSWPCALPPLPPVSSSSSFPSSLHPPSSSVLPDGSFPPQPALPAHVSGMSTDCKKKKVCAGITPQILKQTQMNEQINLEKSATQLNFYLKEC